jgi:hypothetical protein
VRVEGREGGIVLLLGSGGNGGEEANCEDEQERGGFAGHGDSLSRCAKTLVARTQQVYTGWLGIRLESS